MKFTCYIRELKRAMTGVKKAMYLKSVSVPVLACIRFNAVGDTVGMVGTDLETMIGEEIAADVEQEGEACVFYKALESCFSGTPKADDEVSFHHDGSIMRVTVDGMINNLSIGSVVEFPIVPHIPVKQKVNLADGIKKCYDFVSDSDSDTRTMIAGVHVNSTEHELVFVATDGKSMKIVRQKPIKEQFAITIPKKACKAITLRFAGKVQMGLNATDGEFTQLRLHSKGELITRLIDMQYPDYESVLRPAKSLITAGDAQEIELDRFEFTSIIEKVSSMQSKAQYAPIFAVSMEVKDGVMEVRYNNKEAFQQACITPITSNGDVMMAFNPLLLLRVLKSFSSDTVSMYVKPAKVRETAEPGHMKNPTGTTLDPVYFDGDENEDTVIMPMKLEQRIEPTPEKEEKDDGKTDSDNGG